MFSLKLSVTRLKKYNREYNMVVNVCNGNFVRGITEVYVSHYNWIDVSVIAPASNTKPSTHTLTHHTL